MVSEDFASAIFQIGYMEPREPCLWMGTGFLFGGENMALTAKHVVDVKKPEYLFGISHRSKLHSKIKRVIHDPLKDIAKLELESCDIRGLQPMAQEIAIGADVYSFGYPTPEEGQENVGGRYLKGYITRFLEQPFGFQQPSYELSFPIPEGLSGSPLLLYHSGVKVTGLIYGNSRSEIIEDSYEETTTGNEKKTHSTSRIVSYGLAHRLETIM